MVHDPGLVFLYTFIRTSAEQDLAGIIDCQNGFALGAAEPSRLGSLEFLTADRAFEDLGKRSGLGAFPLLREESDSFFQILFDVEKLGKAQQLKDFIHLRLDFQKDQIPSAGFNGFQKGGKRTDAGTRNVVQTGTVKNQPGETRFDRFRYTLLEIVGVVCVDIAGEVENKTSGDLVDLLKSYLEAVVFFVIKSRYDIVIHHY
jgi:hypothetical protein